MRWHLRVSAWLLLLEVPFSNNHGSKFRQYFVNFGNFTGQQNKNPKFHITLMYVLYCKCIILDSIFYCLCYIFFNILVVINHANILFRSKKLKKSHLLLKSQKKMTKFHEFLGSFDGGWKFSNTETEICLRT